VKRNLERNANIGKKPVKGARLNEKNAESGKKKAKNAKNLQKLGEGVFGTNRTWRKR
jgi:hypothetical protein